MNSALEPMHSLEESLEAQHHHHRAELLRIRDSRLLSRVGMDIKLHTEEVDMTVPPRDSSSQHTAHPLAMRLLHLDIRLPRLAIRLPWRRECLLSSRAEWQA